jgi:hypothetical protein
VLCQCSDQQGSTNQDSISRKIIGVSLSHHVQTGSHTFTSLGCMYILYFTPVRPRLEYVCVVWNSITSTDANKLKGIQQKIAVLRFSRFFPHADYRYAYALHKVKIAQFRWKKVSPRCTVPYSISLVPWL